MHQLYIEKRSHDANLLINARQFYNSLEDTFICKYSTTFKIAKLGQNILRHSVGEKRKKIHVSAIESKSDVYYILQEQHSKRHDYYLIIKLQITFNGDKLHHYD